MPAWRGLRTTDSFPLGRWSYTRYATGEVELYDLDTDPWELTNLAGNGDWVDTRRRLEAAFATLHAR